jgi:hypothetical protein
MAEHRSEAENREEEESGELRRELARERRRERQEERRVSLAIGFADFMGILMVVATAFSAFATWRTAQVTSLVFSTADRPFLGVSGMQFEATESPNPYVAVLYRNFGRIPAIDGLVSVNAWIDGKIAPDPMPEAMATAETGSIPPEVNHVFYRYLSPDSYRDIVSGKSHLRVDVRMFYKGPASGSQYCDSKRFIYDYRTATFRPSGGSNKCGGRPVF